MASCSLLWHLPSLPLRRVCLGENSSERLAQSSEGEMADWVLMSVRRAVIDGFFDKIWTNLKVEYEGRGGEEISFRIKDIIDYLKEADKKKKRCSDEAKKKEIGDWAEDAQKLLCRLEEQIDLSMLPTPRDTVEMSCRSLLDLFSIRSRRWNAPRWGLAKLVKEVEEVRKRMPEDEVMSTAVEIMPEDEVRKRMPEDEVMPTAVEIMPEDEVMPTAVEIMPEDEVRKRMPEDEVMPTAVEIMPEDEVMPTAVEIMPEDEVPFTDFSTVEPDRRPIMIGMHDSYYRLERLMVEGGGRKLIFIVGQGGTGKTSLAWVPYNSCTDRTRPYGRHSWVVSWVLVSMSSEKLVLKSVLKGFYRSSPDVNQSEIDNMDENELRCKIQEYCREKNYLLVLDDVLDKKAWEWLRSALPDEPGHAGRIIFTTRNEGLSQAIEDVPKEIIPREGLSKTTGEPELLFYFLISCDQPGLQEIKELILNKCDGNPFCIKAIAGILRSKQPTPEAWKDVLEDLHANLAKYPESDPTVPFVLLAYADLPSHLKTCFLYCSFFPENFVISRKRLIRLWVAEGYVQEIPGKTEEEAAEHQMGELIDRNMLQAVTFGLKNEVGSCRVLQLVRKIAEDIPDRQNFGSFAPAIGGRPSNNQAARPKQRVLSVEVEGNTEQITKALTRSFHLRSLLVFGTGKLRRLFRHQFPNPTNLKIWPYKLLRVLELQDVQIEFLPEQLRYLALLRYLGLRRMGVKRLPESLGSLQYLETLDIRETNVVEVSDVHGLQKMRHLHLASSFRGRSVNVRRGLSCLIHLQTLAGVTCTLELAQELGCLTQLRKLSISNVQGTSSEQLCTSISKMMLLRSLTIKCDYGHGETFDLRLLSSLSNEARAPLQHLRTLKLGGPIDKLPDLVSSLESITYLYLWDSWLQDDPMKALQFLPNLVRLSLYNAYDGKHLRCNDNSFRKLKKLSVLSLRGLDEWDIGSGAMPLLSELFVGYCPKLTKPPKGLRKMDFLDLVQVAEMHEGFVKLVEKESLKRGGFKVQCIPQYQRA